jgi:hypothetical protein
MSCCFDSKPIYLTRLLNWWPLYREGNTIIIQNELIVGESYGKIIGNKIFSLETCYDFIQPRKISKSKYKPSEWEIDLYESFK